MAIASGSARAISEKAFFTWGQPGVTTFGTPPPLSAGWNHDAGQIPTGAGRGAWEGERVVTSWMELGRVASKIVADKERALAGPS